MEWNVPWATKLRAAYKENYKTDARNRDRLRGTSRGAKDGAETCGTGHLHTCTPTTTGRPVLASQRTDGSAKAQSIPFLDFLRSDPRVLLFAAAARNQELMSVVKINQTHELHCSLSSPTTASFKCTSLEAMATTAAATTAVSTGKKASNDDEATRALHMAAFDNFCVLVFRVLKVEHQFVGSDKLPGKENQN
ncbi:hypothetical protein HDU84_003435 [Entophlyctis sp. JEL0112]|nr:hypothetical protein HDU84_003435 [Entophlyctis sp. JEL0112]